MARGGLFRGEGDPGRKVDRGVLDEWINDVIAVLRDLFESETLLTGHRDVRLPEQRSCAVIDTGDRIEMDDGRSAVVERLSSEVEGRVNEVDLDDVVRWAGSFSSVHNHTVEGAAKALLQRVL